jgi:hypothetical protein
MEAMHMLKIKNGFRFGRLLAGTLLVTATAAGSATAGNVYSWVTEEGTYAFTDDSKRIPAKHRNDAQRRPMGELARYERFTEVSTDQDKTYAERIVERRDALRTTSVATPRVVTTDPAQSTAGIGYTLPAGGGSRGARSTASVWLPLGATGASSTAAAADEGAPTVIESKRMRSPGRLATRHWTFITKGDEVVTVIKGEHRDRNLDRDASESRFDYWDPSDR